MMNARITPRDAPQRTDLYSGVRGILCDGETVWIATRIDDHRLPLRSVAEIVLDEEPGGLEE